jgi:hypothetical protein
LGPRHPSIDTDSTLQLREMPFGSGFDRETL